MRRIKAYKDFQMIKESVGFGQSEEYRQLKEKYDKISKEYFQEHFYDITDENIAGFNYWSYIGDSNGVFIENTDVKDNDYYICYGISIRPTDKSIDTSSIRSIEELKKVSDNINRLVNSVESFENRISHDGLTITTSSMPMGVTPSMREIKLSVRGAKIDKSDINRYYSLWKSGRGPRYDEGINKLKEQYRKNGIPNVELDTNEYFDEDIVNVGFMMLEDEIIAVATYSKKNDDFDIDWPEFRRSVKEYRESIQ